MLTMKAFMNFSPKKKLRVRTTLLIIVRFIIHCYCDIQCFKSRPRFGSILFPSNVIVHQKRIPQLGFPKDNDMIATS